jgi:hypothetical protein
MFYNMRGGGPGAASVVPEVARRLAAVADDLASRAAALAGFCDRHPGMAMASGLEPLALEMKMILRDGALARVSSAAGAALRGAGAGAAAHRDLDMVQRAAELGREAHRRALAHETHLLERPARSLGQGIETAVSLASSLVLMVTAVL